ncbi:Putative peptidoglycan binding domain-containing protein [Caldanaerovirga acetigignens]|uniref:Putative peptidoglycan binding domain-containing protein n=1 Tax=Caldanaerovirga acetigignens TaxID=447595 RepID=A0A1M7HC97_9FIRM|nr:peptidoglycan-binding domain-containing protein [Caldanaerovirga acetigignens]SHM26085.1 Putative peptidoglycan binding domain-containing protein [Caldanaerovirga acetigignens]
MNKKLFAVALLVLTAFIVSIVAPVQVAKLFKVDAVSAATDSSNDKPAENKTQTMPAKTSQPAAAKTATTKTTSTAVTSVTGIKRLLAYGSVGQDVKLLQTLLNQHGYKLKVDGIFGPKTLAAVKDFQKKNGLKVDGIVGPKTLAKLAPKVAASTEKPATPPVPQVPVQTQKVAVKIGKVDYAAHGTKCYTVAVAAVAGDKIVAAYIDDYQFMSKDVAKGVPNMDQEFGTYVKEGYVLASKLTNADYYSNNMRTRGGATKTVSENFGGIVKFVKGKTIAELEAMLASNDKEQMKEKVDAVTGATLEDTYGYVKAIVEAAKVANAAPDADAMLVEEKDLANLKIGKIDYAAHGTKCFTFATAVVLGDKIVAAYIDDYQFMSKDVAKGVPNMDQEFGTYVKEGYVLASKLTNADYYSNNMRTRGGATKTVSENFGGIVKFVKGKTIAELEAMLASNDKEQMKEKVDAVTGATLEDTYGYVKAIVEAAKVAK